MIASDSSTGPLIWVLFVGSVVVIVFAVVAIVAMLTVGALAGGRRARIRRSRRA